MQVTLSVPLVIQLQKAAGDLNSALLQLDNISTAIQGLNLALLAAERELFISLKRGPVYRFVQQRSAFAKWASQARDVITGATGI